MVDNQASLLTALSRGVTFLRAVVWPWRRLTSCTVSRSAPRTLYPAAPGLQVLVLLLDSGYFCLQLVDHSFEKFSRLCDSTLEHALHDGGVLSLKVVR